MKTTEWNRKLLLCGAALSVLAASACAEPNDSSDEGASEEVSEQALVAATSGSSTLTVPNPNGTYFVDVVPNGSGCPLGSTNTSISSDGLVFTTTFSQYEINFTSSMTQAVKDCTLAIKLRSPSGMSYSISEFSYGGYATVPAGATARQMAQYWFQGSPVRPAESYGRMDLTGPYDDSYLFKDVLKTTDLVWSPCGLDRDLNVLTRIRVNNPSRGAGYVNLAAVDGSLKSKVVFKVNTRKCSP